MAKTLILQKEGAEEFKENWLKEKSDVQAVIDLYNALGLPKLQTGNELSRMCNNTQSFMFEKLTQGKKAHLVFGSGDDATHMEIEPTKALDMLAKPKGYNELLAGISELEKSSRDGEMGSGTRWLVKDIAKNFTIDKDGNLQFTELLQTLIDEWGKCYVRTKRGKAYLKFAKAIIKAAQENELFSNGDPAPYLETVLNTVFEKGVSGYVTELRLKDFSYLERNMPDFLRIETDEE